MGLFDDIKQIDTLIAEGKLKIIYLQEGLEDEIRFIPIQRLTQMLHGYSAGKLELSEEQLNALINDIEILKHYKIWDVDTEQETIKQCKKSIENTEHYKRLSADDKTKYDAHFYLQFEI